MFAANPVRELAFGLSIPGGHGSTTGNAVSLAPFVGPVSLIVFFKDAALASNKTITFQVASEDPDNIGSPLNASWTTVQTSSFCGNTPANIDVVIDIENAQFIADDGLWIERVTLPCPADFVRAVSSATDDAIVVIVAGKARRVVEN